MLKLYLVAILQLVLFWPVVVFAQTPPPVQAHSADWSALLMPLIIATVPIIVIFAKKLIPAKYSVFYPVLATVLGPVLDYIAAWASSNPARPGLGVALGLAGVGLRELIDQMKKSVASTVNP